MGRPMSVWVNVTYAPLNRQTLAIAGSVGHVSARPGVLVHNRGRLKHELVFIRMLQRMAGPRFQYDIIPQNGRILHFVEIASSHAVVFVPWSPESCMLRHLIRMHVPTFVPDRALLRNLIHT